jgi:hypothetical protein
MPVRMEAVHCLSLSVPTRSASNLCAFLSPGQGNSGTRGNLSAGKVSLATLVTSLPKMAGRGGKYRFQGSKV